MGKLKSNCNLKSVLVAFNVVAGVVLLGCLIVGKLKDRKYAYDVNELEAEVFGFDGFDGADVYSEDSSVYSPLYEKYRNESDDYID